MFLKIGARFQDDTQARNFAVNARDFNAAAMTFISSLYLRRNSPKSMSHCRIVSSSRHTPTF
jgi:hypothetical protein